MSNYAPSSRRPIADLFRLTAHAAVRVCVRFGIRPDVVSYASIVAAAAAGLSYWQAGAIPELLILAPLFGYLRLWLNMLDGMVALAAGKASPRGEILNDLPDRVSDVLIFVGVAHSGLGSPLPAYWAALAALMTAYVGTLGQAVAGRREYGGLMSKPWRMVMLHVGAWTAFLLLRSGRAVDGPLDLSVLDWSCLVVIVGCVQTIVVRLRRTLGALSGRSVASKGRDH